MSSLYNNQFYSCDYPVRFFTVTLIADTDNITYITHLLLNRILSNRSHRWGYKKLNSKRVFCGEQENESRMSLKEELEWTCIIE